LNGSLNGLLNGSPRATSGSSLGAPLVVDTSNSSEMHPVNNFDLIPGLTNDVSLLCLARIPYIFRVVCRQVSRAWNTVSF
jgi:hypothetical protein